MFDDSRLNTIREMAYAKWELAGRPCGDGVDFWLDAEKDFENLAAADEPNESASGTKPRKSTIPPPPLKLAKIAGESRKRFG